MDKFATLLEQLAKVVGIQIERLWPEVIKVYWVTTLIDVVMWPPILIIVGLLVRHILRLGLAIKNDAYGWPGSKAALIIPAIIAGSAVAVGAIIYFALLSGMLGALINPEASYVMEQLGRIKR